jgi:sugar lactone lactonase YvrE
MKPMHRCVLSAELGEGIACMPDGNVYCVDIPAGAVYQVTSAGSVLRYRSEGEISKVLPWRGGFILMGRLGPIWVDEGFHEVAALTLHDESSNLRCSDATVLPNGDVILGVVERDLRQAAGRLLYLSPLGVSEVVAHTTISNGVCLGADGQTLAWIDSAQAQIELFDWDKESRTLGHRRVLCTIPAELGVPDGMCADTDGGWWVAMWSGSAVLRIDEEGRIDERIELPVPHVTSVCFSAEDDLLITTARATLTPEQQLLYPQAGDVWVLPASEHGRKGVSPSVAALRPEMLSAAISSAQAISYVVINSTR